MTVVGLKIEGGADPDAGDGALVLNVVESFLRRFIAYPSQHALIAHVLWIAHTYLLEQFDTTPRLAFMSAEKMSGKTRALLEVTPLLVRCPIPSVNASPAVILRLADKDQGTILYDEIDAIFGNVKNQEANTDLCSLMNAGYRRGAKVRRWNVNHNAPDEFNAFAPLAVAGLRTLPDTLASRAIFIRMKRRSPTEKVEPFRWRNASKEAEPIKYKLEEWCIGIADQISLETKPPEMPSGIEDRDADIWEPLLAIADVAGGQWPKRARDAAVALTKGAADETVTTGTELLAHCRDAFDGAPKLLTTELIDSLNGRDELPWLAMRNGLGINDRLLAKQLKVYGIKSKDIAVGNNKCKKGYAADAFKDDWDRYLPPARGERDERDLIDNNNKNIADIADIADTPGDGDEFTSLKSDQWRLR